MISLLTLIWEIEMKFEDVDAYLHRVTPKRDRTQAAMEVYARKNGFPIIGPLVGRFLWPPKPKIFLNSAPAMGILPTGSRGRPAPKDESS
jgi:hypothetical protein